MACWKNLSLEICSWQIEHFLKGLKEKEALDALKSLKYKLKLIINLNMRAFIQVPFHLVHKSILLREAM